MLPPGVEVIERGWLSANNVVLKSQAGAVLVDSGYVAHAPQTLVLLDRALGTATLGWLVNTHCHSDHMGGNAAVQQKYGCRTSIPAGEAPLIDAWSDTSLILGFADQRADRFRYDDTFPDGAVLRMGELDWQVIAAPGHDTHAVMFYAPEARVLISGDALWENGFGVVLPQLFGRDTALEETRRTLQKIAGLDVEHVIPGHGRVFTGVKAALERALERVEYYRGDIGRLARHCAKVMLSFSLLEKRSMPLAGLPAYVGRVPILVELNQRYLHMAAPALAEWLVSELERAGAAQRRDGMLVAAGP